MKTTFPSKDAIVRSWHVVDAENKVLGRIASEAAKVLMGKTKPGYTPFLDTGDHVIVLNASKVRLTGKKETAETAERKNHQRSRLRPFLLSAFPNFLFSK